MIRYEIHKLYLNSGILILAGGFFALSLFCFLLVLGPDVTLLNRCAPSFIWLMALLTLLFSTSFLLKAEFQAGILDEMLLQPSPPAFSLVAKMTAEVLLLGVPLILTGMVFAPFFFLSFKETLFLGLTLLVGFPALSALGLLGGLLTLNARGGNLLISLLILPLTLPLLLFALSVMERVQMGLDSFAPFCLLTSVSLLLLMIAIGAGQWALSLSMED